MLRSRVRLGRSLTRSDQIHEYAVTLEGEISFPAEDPEGVLEKVAELFHLAEEALAREIERGSENRPDVSFCPEPTGATRSGVTVRGPHHETPSGPRTETATAKQVQFLLGLAKRQGLSRDELDAVVARVGGSPKKLGDLTKKEAGQIIAHLNHQTEVPK